MSASAKDRVEFVFKIVDGLNLKWQRFTLSDLIAECCKHIDSQQSHHNQWERSILSAMRDIFSDEQNMQGLESRLNSIKLYADSHPEKDALITDLARRALLGELRGSGSRTGLKEFSENMEKMYAGKLIYNFVWEKEWAHFVRRLNIAPQEDA